MGQRLSVIYHRKNGYARAVNDPRDDDDDDDDDFPAASQKKSSSSTVSKKLGRWMSRITRHRSATPSADVPAADVPADVPGETARDECETGVQSTHHWRDGGLVRRANAAVAAADGKVHTSEDYIHFLVPDLLQITNNPFYWGKIDRYGAERLLDQAPEGTFLLRDSAHDEYVFSVSFRKHGRVLHARIEQWDRRFSLDARDPSVFSSSTVRGLLEHYKDPSNCMFFEPTLAVPLPRNFVFSLQHTCRAAVCDRIAYEDVNQLSLPHALKSYLKEYHYKQRVRTRKFDLEN